MAPGLFGDIDAEEVSDNPFYVAPDTYLCVLSEANVVTKKDGSEEQAISIKWVIQDEDSDYYQNNVSEWFNIWPDVTADEITAKQRKDMARLKGRLKSLGLTPEQMNVLLDDDNLDMLVGTEAYVEVVETVDKEDPDKKYTNVRSVRLTEE